MWLGDARCVAVAREKATLFVSPLDKKDAFHEALKTQIGNHPQINLFSKNTKIIFKGSAEAHKRLGVFYIETQIHCRKLFSFLKDKTPATCDKVEQVRISTCYS